MRYAYPTFRVTEPGGTCDSISGGQPVGSSRPSAKVTTSATRWVVASRLHAALAEPASVQRLILVGATAGIADDDARAARRAADEALADRLEGVGVAAFLEDWLAQPMFAGLPREAADIENRLTNTADGLAAALRLLGTGTQAPLDDRLNELTMPVLLVVGARDAKFRDEAERLKRGIRHAEIAEIAGAGHACHLEQPDAFCEVVEGWLTATQPTR